MKWKILSPTNASSIEITIALSRIYLRRVILSVLTIEKSRVLALQLFKVKGNLSNTIMSYIFPTRVLNRSQTDFFRNTVNATKFGLNALRYFASKVWSMIPIDIKNFSSVELFKNKSGSLTTVTANFVKIIFIELDMLNRLILIQLLSQFWYRPSRIPGIFSHINWRDVVIISKCDKVPECSSETFY